jgi:hypothetical protein
MNRTRKFGRRSAISLTCLTFATTILASSAITIENPSFEDPVLDELATGDPAGWDAVNNGGGAFHPAAAQFAGGAPDGDNVASMYQPTNGDGLSQTLSGPAGLLQADATYTLGVEVGDPADGSFGGYTIQLLAGETTLAEDIDSVTPADGGFTKASRRFR